MRSLGRIKITSGGAQQTFFGGLRRGGWEISIGEYRYFMGRAAGDSRGTAREGADGSIEPFCKVEAAFSEIGKGQLVSVEAG